MNRIPSFSAGVFAGCSLTAAALFLAGKSATEPGATARDDFALMPASVEERMFPAEEFEAEAIFEIAEFPDSAISRNPGAPANPAPKSEEISLGSSAIPAYVGKDAIPGIREAEAPPGRIIDESSSRYGQLPTGHQRTAEPSCPKSAGEIAMSVGSLAVLSKMSTEKIDSLTRLMSSLRPSESAGAVGRRRSAPDFPRPDNRSPGEARISTVPFFSNASDARPDDWTVRGDGVGAAHLVNIDDASESFPVRPGMVIGELGPIGQIEWFDTEIGVVFENGHEIVGGRNLEKEAED